MSGGGEEGATLEFTTTWVVAAFCIVIVAISLTAERLLHYGGMFLKARDQKPLYIALCQWKHWEDSIAKQNYETDRGNSFHLFCWLCSLRAQFYFLSIKLINSLEIFFLVMFYIYFLSCFYLKILLLKCSFKPKVTQVHQHDFFDNLICQVFAILYGVSLSKYASLNNVISYIWFCYHYHLS